MADSDKDSKGQQQYATLTALRRSFSELLQSKNLGDLTVERCYDFIVVTMTAEETVRFMDLIRKIPN